MNYKLPDGTIINLADLYEVSEIKDLGEDTNTIDESTLSFSIRLTKCHSLKVTKNYHYNDWFDALNELKKIREDLILQWEKYKQKHGN